MKRKSKELVAIERELQEVWDSIPCEEVMGRMDKTSDAYLKVLEDIKRLHGLRRARLELAKEGDSHA